MRKFNGNFSFTFFLVAVGIVLSSFSLPIFGAIPSQERAALIALYNSTAGDNWTNKSGWKTPPLDIDGFAMSGTENNWYWITCDPGNTTVQSISLTKNNLDGSLPMELGNLANLKNLYLYSNQLSGSIPPELGNLVNLKLLYLDRNQLSGSIPPELGNLANLAYLNLNGNQLSGSLPPELGNLTKLEWLWLSSNQLSGTIPQELGNLDKLDDLSLGSNQLSGTIPPELGNLANLQSLYLSSNQLSGTIPPELGNLANLQYLFLSSNQLSGSIPPELGNLANLYYLSLSSNQLSGTIPPELGNLANLKILDFSSNLLSSSIPPELGNLANLQYLFLSSNQLSGSIPPELGNLANLQRLNISHNQLSGSIPPELGNLANLEYIDLRGNQFSGSIPPELGNLANLQRLYLSSNQLSGSIPSNLSNLTNLCNGCLNLKWNALYTKDDILRAFLDSKQSGGNWESTQTIAPSDMTAVALSTTSIDIDWTPIFYIAGTGGYRLFCSTTPGGPYTYFCITANKSASSLTVTGLEPNTNYYFVVQTRTNPHAYNQNTVDSEYSAEVSAETFSVTLTISGTVTSGGNGLQGVTVTLSSNGGTATTDANGNYSVTVDYGWTGTATPSKAGYNFSPPNRSYSNVTVNQTNQDFLGNPVTVNSLTLTSPNGGESWGLNTIRNITWTSSGITGNIRLELWKANKKLCDIANNIPIVNGNYAWGVGIYTIEPIPPGNDYSVKILTANGVYTDTSNENFSIVIPSITLTSPRNGEKWKLGTQQNITWTSVGLTDNVNLILLKGGVKVGTIAQGIPIANGTYAWTVGSHSNGMATAGRKYTVKICTEDNRFMDTSGSFRITE